MKRDWKQILLPVSQPHLQVLSTQPLRWELKLRLGNSLAFLGSGTASSDTAFSPLAMRTSPGNVLCFPRRSDTAGLTTGDKLLSHRSLSSFSAAASHLPRRGRERDEKGRERYDEINEGTQREMTEKPHRKRNLEEGRQGNPYEKRNHT